MSTMLTPVEQKLEDAKKLLLEISGELEPVAALGIDALDTKHKLKLLMLLRDFKKVGSDYESLHNKYVDGITTRLYKELEALGVDNVDVPYDGNVYRVKTDTAAYVSIKDELYDEFLAYMDAHPKGRELVTRSVHPKTLNKFLTDEIMGAGQLPPPCMSVFVKENINVRKLPKKT